jgi:putative cell wall-binding protein
VITQLGAVGARVTRIAGSDRYDTVARVADSVDKAGREILPATGADFPDALGTAAVARRMNATLVLTAPGAMSAAASRNWGRRAPEGLTVLGGYLAVSRRADSEFAVVHLR